MSSYWNSVLRQRTSRRRALAAFGAAGVGAAILSACGGGDDNGGGEGDKSSLLAKPVDTTKQAKRDGIIKDRIHSDIRTFDMFQASNPLNALAYHVYSSLVLFEPGYMKRTEQKLAPDIAESWETSPDGLTVTLKVRPGVKFHNLPPVNGRTMDKDDLLFSWDRFVRLNPIGRVVANAVNPQAPVLSLTAPDDRTLVMKLKQPTFYVLGLIAANGSGSLTVLPKETDKTFDISKGMIGTGPFYLADYKPSVSFTLKRFDEAWNAKDVALAAQIDLPIISEYAATLSQFRAGNIWSFGNFTAGTQHINPDDVLATKQDVPDIQIHQLDPNSVYTLDLFSFGWHPEAKSPFLDERVRQAVSMSWDRDLFLDTFLNVTKFAASGIPIATQWHSNLESSWEGWWLDPKGKDFGPNAKYFQHNIADAKALLSAAGYPNGLETKSNYVTGPELGNLPQAAAVLDGMMAEAGIRSKVNALDYLTTWPTLRASQGKFEGWAYAASTGTVDGGSAIVRLSNPYWSKGPFLSGLSAAGKSDGKGDPTLDAMFDKALAETDVERQRSQTFEIQRYLAKAAYGLKAVGAGGRLIVTWPALGNFNTWHQDRNNYRLWADDTKAPLKKA